MFFTTMSIKLQHHQDQDQDLLSPHAEWTPRMHLVKKNPTRFAGNHFFTTNAGIDRATVVALP